MTLEEWMLKFLVDTLLWTLGILGTVIIGGLILGIVVSRILWNHKKEGVVK